MEVTAELPILVPQINAVRYGKIGTAILDKHAKLYQQIVLTKHLLLISSVFGNINIYVELIN